MSAKFQKKSSIKETIAVQETENVTLTTTVTTEHANVSWFRDGVQLKEGNKYEMKREGSSHVLIIKSSEAKDRGTYMCQTADDKMEFQVEVKGKNLWQVAMSVGFHFLQLTSFLFWFFFFPSPRDSTKVCGWPGASICCSGQLHDPVLQAKQSCWGCPLEAQWQRNEAWGQMCHPC